MSSVKRKTITSLNVVFDATVKDSQTGEVLYNLALPMRFDDADGSGWYECRMCPGLVFDPGLNRKWLMVELRMAGDLWQFSEVECPTLFESGDQIRVVPRMTLSDEQWQKLLELAQ